MHGQRKLLNSSVLKRVPFFIIRVIHYNAVTYLDSQKYLMYEQCHV